MKSLLVRCAREDELHAEELASAVARAKDAKESEELAWSEFEEMRVEVAEAKAREAVLREIVERNLLK